MRNEIEGCEGGARIIILFTLKGRDGRTEQGRAVQ
jgi:hypothetical protein